MKPWSKLFDAIRVKPREEDIEPEHFCEWAGCKKPAPHRAPQSPQNLNAYRWFCLDHVRAYNRDWDYFRGMSDADIAAYQRDALTGHRPTWKMGEKSATDPRKKRLWRDDFRLFPDEEADLARAEARARERDHLNRNLPPALRKALGTLGLEEGASLNDIKTRYKELVKLHHPDANGGDRSEEARLREVITAYQQLRKSGLMRSSR